MLKVIDQFGKTNVINPDHIVLIRYTEGTGFLSILTVRSDVTIEFEIKPGDYDLLVKQWGALLAGERPARRAQPDIEAQRARW